MPFRQQAEDLQLILEGLCYLRDEKVCDREDALSRKAKLIAISVAFAMGVSGAVLGPAFAVPDYPSWEEVEAAKDDVEEKEKLIEELEGYLAELGAELDELNTIALIKNEEYNQAVEEVNILTRRVEQLKQEVANATEEAESVRLQLGQMAARMYREGAIGNSSLELFFNPDSADDLLYQLGTQEIIASRTETIYQRSLDKQANAESLAQELEAAEAELEEKRVEAEQALQEAQDAAAAVQAKVDENEALNAEMVRQLAELRDTAEELERQRAEGLAAEARQRAVGTPPTAPELYSVGSPKSGLVEQAIDFARQQLGERYVLGGAGPNVWDCSGITMKAYAAAGVYIGWHSATAQYRIMAKQEKLVPFQDAQRGDLIWWSKETAFDGDKYHVAIYLGDGMMLEAPNPARTVRVVPVRYGELWPYAGRPTASSTLN